MRRRNLPYDHLRACQKASETEWIEVIDRAELRGHLVTADTIAGAGELPGVRVLRSRPGHGRTSQIASPVPNRTRHGPRQPGVLRRAQVVNRTGESAAVSPTAWIILTAAGAQGARYQIGFLAGPGTHDRPPATMTGVPASFDELVAEAGSVDVSGWDFTWLDGRASEHRPSWGYQRLMSERLATVNAALDIQTGGGEVLAQASRFPATMAATESWPANVALAAQRLHPRGVVVVSDPDEPPLPFADASFDLVTSRHPATVWWKEIARVLRPGGSYLAQHVGPESASELYEFFLGPQSTTQHPRHPGQESARAAVAGLKIRTIRMERLRMEFFDIGAVVYFLRKVVWTVPDFTIERFRDRLHDLHEQIHRDGRFVAHSSRVLIEADKST